MKAFLDEDFLLDGPLARALYHEVAAPLPILDYHSHLVPAELAARKRFRNITELWLGADHYKWRLMRSAGVPEALITGDADEREKFRAFCRVLPLAIGNPVHHFCHLELRRLFATPLVICAENADALWEATSARLAELDCWALLQRSNVEVVCTTDDPADSLAEHQALAGSALSTRVLPALRPDRAMRINHPGFTSYLDTLGQAAGLTIDSFAALLHALARRIDFFHSLGCRVSDHGVDLPLPTSLPTLAELEALFARRLQGARLSGAEESQYIGGLLRELAPHYHRKGLAMCLHLGALRNVSSRRLAELGPDAGFDTIGEMPLAVGLATLFDALDRERQLPRTLLFPSNPVHNALLAALIGSFQDDTAAGKLQLGPAWWFNDHKDGNLAQLRSLASHGVLGTFVGMVTDSRSFASYPRHEYFRRLLCRLLGHYVEAGEYPDDRPRLRALVEGICYRNAKIYFNF